MSVSDILLEEKFICLALNNQSDKKKLVEKKIDSSFIQFHFSLKGKSELNFNEGNYILPVEKMSYLTLYNPEKDLPLNITVNPNSSIVCVLISITKFHKLLSNYHENKTPFLSSENINQKYYKNNDISNSMLAVLNEIINKASNNLVRKLYLKGKLYELFSVLFDKENNTSNEQCPYIINDEQLRKIKLAKDIITKEYNKPPTLQELSERTKISLRKLKTGFKEIYGKPVFQYLLEYKMTLAKNLLQKDKHNVNEISAILGYSTASHFISAFKKKYGVTPKSYMLNN